MNNYKWRVWNEQPRGIKINDYKWNNFEWKMYAFGQKLFITLVALEKLVF